MSTTMMGWVAVVCVAIATASLLYALLNGWTLGLKYRPTEPSKATYDEAKDRALLAEVMKRHVYDREFRDGYSFEMMCDQLFVVRKDAKKEWFSSDHNVSGGLRNDIETRWQRIIDRMTKPRIVYPDGFNHRLATWFIA